MNALHRNTVLTSLVIGMAVAGAACNQRTPSTTSENMSNPPSTTSQSSSPPQTAMAPTTPPPTTPPPTTSNQMSGAVDDAAISAQVKTAIMAEPGLKATNINVDAKDGVVTLSGTVPSAPLKDRAKEIASNVAGVKSVQDNLTTQSG